MSKNKVYYDYHDGELVPIWYVIEFPGGVDWSHPYFHLPIQAPFEKQNAEDFDSDMLGVSVTMNDLTLTAKHNHIGIDLLLIQKRLDEAGIDKMDVKQFIIQVADIEEILQMER
jgi:hypothetical protein